MPTRSPTTRAGWRACDDPAPPTRHAACAAPARRERRHLPAARHRGAALRPRRRGPLPRGRDRRGGSLARRLGPRGARHPRARADDRAAPGLAAPAPRGHVAELGKTVKRILAMTAEPGFGSVIGRAADRCPLGVEAGCLYTERSRQFEKRVAETLAARVRTTAPVSVPGAPGLSVEQNAAVRLAVSGALTVVTGGPGTGKTLVAAAIVRAFTQLGIGPIALAAQTGKAANRLTEVMVQQLGAEPPPPAGQTLHRLLGYRGDGFAHHAQSPLPVGAVIVDEASMIDLELMDALLDALPASVPLVLIGDAHQLPAIAAGQILADLVGPASPPTPATLPRGYEAPLATHPPTD